MTFPTMTHLTFTRVTRHWQFLLVAVAVLGFCSCQSPQSGHQVGAQPHGGGPYAQQGRPHSAPLPSPAQSAAAARQQQWIAQQRVVQQQIMAQQAARQRMQQQHPAMQQQRQSPLGPANVTPVAFNGPIGNRAAPAEVVSTSQPPPCTAPYCQPHGRSFAPQPMHGAPKYYLPGPDAPNLGGRREDEFLCDGGDKDVEVVIGNDWSVHGLNLEDTVAHFDTLDGDRIVEPSNCVCIYAPRFAAVRQVRGAYLKKQRVRIAGVEYPEQLIQQDDLQITSTKVQQIQPLGELGRKGLVIFEERTRGLLVDNTLLPKEFANEFAAHENFQVIRIGIHQNSEEAFLAKSIEAAVVWETKQAVQVVIDKKDVHIQKGVAAAQEFDHYEERGEPKMRVIKVASTKHASPGDEIEFTIRFDNIGTEKVGNVTIIDNLTTRLEYVPDSAQCSVKADFLTQLNEGESLVLRWEVNDPLKPGEGGIIRFKCRVR
jgi:uncharacterized repeat protein (TIGR01451 family)